MIRTMARVRVACWPARVMDPEPREIFRPTLRVACWPEAVKVPEAGVVFLPSRRVACWPVTEVDPAPDWLDRASFRVGRLARYCERTRSGAEQSSWAEDHRLADLRKTGGVTRENEPRP